jgi:DNA-binding NarL/FixJ family response regulator
VLIVETHQGYRRTLVELLAAMGVKDVLTAASPNEVLTALVAEPTLRGAVISHDLPQGDARRAADALWILAPGTPVIFYTGRSEATIDVDAFPAPVALLCKPLRTWDLQATLGKLRKQADTPKRGSTFPLE